jgi:hypothetical protein
MNQSLVTIVQVLKSPVVTLPRGNIPGPSESVPFGQADVAGAVGTMVMIGLLVMEVLIEPPSHWYAAAIVSLRPCIVNIEPYLLG